MQSISSRQLGRLPGGMATGNAVEHRHTNRQIFSLHQFSTPKVRSPTQLHERKEEGFYLLEGTIRSLADMITRPCKR